MSAAAGRYVGAPVRRPDVPKLLRGEATYVDDVDLPGMLHAAIVRAPVAHARITCFDASEAGAQLVLGPAEIASQTESLPSVWLTPDQRQTEAPLGEMTARYVGQPLAVVVAASRADAEDAAESVVVEYDELPAVWDADAALAPGAPLLNPEWGTNVALTATEGDAVDVLDAAFAAADHVISRRLVISRITASPIETRGVVARWDAGTKAMTVWTSTQTPHHVRDHIAHCLRLSTSQVRVIAPSVGGGFGSKEHVYADEVLVCLAALHTTGPVKWIEDRTEHFTATAAARDQIHEASLALDATGRFLGIRDHIIGNLGAHPSNVGAGPLRIAAGALPGPYRFPHARAQVTGVLTNTTPVAACRGFGMQEAVWVHERLIDEAARELGMDGIELRRKNMYREDELPVQTPTMLLYDSGDYPAALDRVRELVTDHWQPRSVDPRIRRGVGYASSIEVTGLGPCSVQEIIGFHIPGFETGLVRVDPDGSVFVSSGVAAIGQGIETSLAQLAADQLGVPIERITVLLGDSAVAPYSGAGSIASRSLTVAGAAVRVAAARVADKMRRIAAHQLEANPDDVELVAGRFGVQGSPGVGRDFADVANSAWLNWNLPATDGPGLEEKEIFDPANSSFAYATHAAAVAVDLDTGRVEVEGYWAVHDSGVQVNPAIVEGQIRGGVVQGLGQALLEQISYGDNAQPTSTTYLDYLLPQNSEAPQIHVECTEHPAPAVPGGMKGIGMGGLIPAPAAIGNAIAAAVPEIAEHVVQTPLQPGHLWELIHRAGLHVMT